MPVPAAVFANIRIFKESLGRMKKLGGIKIFGVKNSSAEIGIVEGEK